MTSRAPDDSSLRSTYLGGTLSILAGVVLLSTPELVLKGVALVLAGSFLIDGIGKRVAAVRAMSAGTARTWLLVAGAVNVGLALVPATGWPVSGWQVVEIVVGLRMLAAGWSMVLGRETPPDAARPADLQPDPRLGLPPHPAFATLNASLQTEEDRRRAIDAWWCCVFVLVFFAIHLGRMRGYWIPVGMIDPLVAVAGDVDMALLLAFGLILPLSLAWRADTPPGAARRAVPPGSRPLAPGVWRQHGLAGPAAVGLLSRQGRGHHQARWVDPGLDDAFKPAAQSADDPVEFIVPMPRR